MKRLAIGLAVIFAACGGDDSTTKHDAAVDTSGGHPDTPTDSKVFMDAPPGTATLTLKNYLNWCKIGIDGATPVQMATATKNLAPGTYNVVASGATGFEIEANMWHHTDGDGGTGETGNQPNGATGESTAMVTMGTTAKCIWVCCQFDTTHMGCGGLAEQCN
jgi:hypothetical protein